jgi:hypothetical protein
LNFAAISAAALAVIGSRANGSTGQRSPEVIN